MDRNGRCYSLLTIRSIDEGERKIEGMATTPTPDRMGDIVEPLGVSFKNPVPLLWQHRSSEPVGTAMFGKPSASGIAFKAQIAKFDDAGRLKDRLDEAWHSVKLGLVRAVSIGFRALEMSFMADTGGIRFIESEVIELSLVTIPANADATINSVKRIDGLVRRGLLLPETSPVTTLQTAKACEERPASYGLDWSRTGRL